MKKLMRKMSCSCGDDFTTPLDVYIANGQHLTESQTVSFKKWLSHHGAASHTKQVTIVEDKSRAAN